VGQQFSRHLIRWSYVVMFWMNLVGGGRGGRACTFARIPNLIAWCTSAYQNKFLIPSVYPPRIAWHHSFKKFSMWLDPLQISAEGHFFLLALSARHQCSKVPIFIFNTPATFEGPPPSPSVFFFGQNKLGPNIGKCCQIFYISTLRIKTPSSHSLGMADSLSLLS